MNNQEKRQHFNKEKDEFAGDVYHVLDDMGNVTNPSLIEIDRLYGLADGLSIENAEKYRKIILWLSVVGGIITWAFLFYDEAELHGLIVACTVFLIILYFIKNYADKLDCHRKYLEYRVLAESLRVQFFLVYAGIVEPVSEMLPWFVRIGIPWISDVLSELHLEKTGKKQPILQYWIINQRNYHKGAIERNTPKYHDEQRIQRIALIITIATYIFTLVVEGFIFFNFLAGYDINAIRAGLKIVIGTAAVFGLFAASYYGNMSLSDTISDSRRMVLLYDEVEKEIIENGGVESEEIIKYLAREFLIENSMWYAYQNQNKPDWVM